MPRELAPHLTGSEAIDCAKLLRVPVVFAESIYLYPESKRDESFLKEQLAAGNGSSIYLDLEDAALGIASRFMSGVRAQGSRPLSVLAVTTAVAKVVDSYAKEEW